uniref:Uncharacterized protein n=1 Tax=Anopheles merus TaxID=30066 RepID=A0A182UZJ0_ANOME
MRAIKSEPNYYYYHCWRISTITSFSTSASFSSRPGSPGLPGRHLTRITIVSSTSRNSSMATNRARMAISPLLSRAIGQGCSWLGECRRRCGSPSSNESSSRASASSSSPSATSPSSRTVVVCAGFRVPLSSSTAPEVLSTSGAERISALERCGRKDCRVERSEGTGEPGRLTLLRQRESCTLGDSVSRLPISPPPDTSHVTRHWLAPGAPKLVPLHTSGRVAVQLTSAVTSDSLRTIRWTVSWSWQRGRADRREPECCSHSPLADCLSAAVLIDFIKPFTERSYCEEWL